MMYFEVVILEHVLMRPWGLLWGICMGLAERMEGIGEVHEILKMEVRY